jgi:hypothetical protein
MELLKKFIKTALIIGGIIFYLVAAYGLIQSGEDKIIRYDCTIAEFHPDIPLEVKEACRNLRRDTSI